MRSSHLLTSKEMQKIAKEMNFSETSFILSDELNNGEYAVRIFTPETEVPFAGHPVLGTAYIIKEEIVKQKIATIALNLKVGQIPVTFNYDEKGEVLWMKQIPPTFGQTFDPILISQALNITVEDIADPLPIQEVSTGIFFIIVPLKTLEALKRARISRDKYFEVIKNAQAKAMLVFCPETHAKRNDFSARVFADYYGVPEDPATGSANGCLAGYLVKYRYLKTDQINVRVEQGYEVGRPSLLLLKAKDYKGTIDVNVGGTVIPIAKGEFV